ncbi:MAG TPA: HRDC domain-containing protein [Streptosporangiaceae bacterium]|nr:HRDC domain-containing protein [Streptosporangiaceae bacterium]
MSATTVVGEYEGAHEGHGSVPLLDPRDGLPPVVETSGALAEATDRLARGEGPVAVDAERASGYRYGQRAYLIQLRRAGAGTILIDPIACPGLSGIDAALADAEAVLHAASQDLPCLAELGFRPRRLFDTELAGRLLGYPRVALGTLVEEVLGFHLEKGHSAADWSARPLRTELLRYAALDVEVLIELRDALAEELAAQGKTEWARQEFAAVLAAKPAAARADPWRRTSGIHRVQSRRALGVVRELWNTRDKIAQAADLSPRRVLPDTAIIEAARSSPANHAQLVRISGFATRQAKRHEQDWLAAISRARSSADSELPDATSGPIPNGPPPAHRWAERDPAAAARLVAARAAVTAVAEASRLPVENLISPDVLRRLSWDPPLPSDPVAVAEALTSYGARAWQVELTAGPVAEAFNAGKSTPPDAGETAEHEDAG